MKKKPHISRIREGAIMGLDWKCTDGHNSGIANNPQDAYEAWKMADAEHRAFNPWLYAPMNKEDAKFLLSKTTE